MESAMSLIVNKIALDPYPFLFIYLQKKKISITNLDIPAYIKCT